MPTPNEKPRPDLNSKIFPLQFRTLFYFCSFDLDGGPVSSTGSTLPLSLFCRRSVSSVLDRLLISRAFFAVHTLASCYTGIPTLLMSPKMQVKRK